MTGRSPIIFRYGFAAGQLSPMATVALLINNQWRVLELYVDSGAYYTLLHAQYATEFGLDPKRGRKVLVQVGDGAFIPVYLHKLIMQIGATRFEAPVGFSDKLGIRFNLLGRLGIFEHFTICFHEKRKLVSFQPLG